MSDLLTNLQYRMGIRKISSLSIRITQNGRRVFKKDLGVTNFNSCESLSDHHLFRVGCLTKPIIAYAVLQLSYQGLLDLNQAIVKYIPALKTHRKFQSITVSHLLSHTSGLARGPYESIALSDKDTLVKIVSSKLLFNPGKHFKYSNWGYYLLGKIIENNGGQASITYIKKYIFSPFKMNNSFFSNKIGKPISNLVTGYWKNWYFGAPNLEDATVPCPHTPLLTCSGGMISTADDYLNWLTELTDTKDNSSKINTEIFNMMLLEQFKLSENYGVCLGLFKETINGYPFYYFLGSNSGFSGFIFIIPHINLVGIALANHSSCNNELRDILFQVCKDKIVNCELPHFGFKDNRFNILAGNRSSLIKLKDQHGNIGELHQDKYQSRLYPHSKNSYFIMSKNHNAYFLRGSNLDSGDAKITIGDQVYYENLGHLKKKSLDCNPWKYFVGIYQHKMFGKVEVIYREQQLFLNYGTVYETLLQPISDVCFKQTSGPFNLEEVTFVKNSTSDKINSFTMSQMSFLKTPSYTIANRANIPNNLNSKETN